MYLNYTKRLEFEERPDYAYLRRLFYVLLQRSEMQFDLKFDWMIPKDKRSNYRRKINRKFKT
jgi:casein kinase 1